MGCDTRIGNKYLKGALPYGGPCFPRDNRALIFLCETIRLGGMGFETTDEINQNQLPLILQTPHIQALLNKVKNVTILGLSYKPFTDVTEESPSLNLILRLHHMYKTIYIYDPKAKVDFGLQRVIQKYTKKDAVEAGDLIFLMTPWPEFYQIQTDKPIIDCWNILPDASNIIKLGRW
jgi:UDPglucose 6-dehydrogenase